MKNAIYCTDCGIVGITSRKMRGSIFIEIVAWLFFIVPGIIYSLWRYTTVARVCPGCASENIIPKDSPRAVEGVAKYKSTLRQQVPGGFEMKNAIYCKDCGMVGISKRKLRGKLWVEIVLWISVFFLPGVIYSIIHDERTLIVLAIAHMVLIPVAIVYWIWRHATLARVCPACGCKSIISKDSPKAVAALAK